MQPDRATRSAGVIPVVSARSVSKSFSGRTVLRGVDLDILPGEIHGLVGQNGSGKSTFIKILSGFHAPDPGARLLVRGEPVSLPLSLNDPGKLGMSFVHQDLGLFEAGSVVESMRVGRYDTGFAWHISWRRERHRVRESLARFGLRLDPDAPISSLTDVQRAMVAIIRALDQTGAGKHGLLVLDEPTSYLPRDTVEQLFDTIRQVAALGFGVLFVTHRLEEVRAITDRVTILRDGAVVETARTSALSQRDLVARILGFSLEQLYPSPHEAEGEVVLEVRHMSGSTVDDFSLKVRRGEIVGLTGLLGMGHELVPYLLFGAERTTHGQLDVHGQRHQLRDMTPRKAMDAGLALLPANRLRDGGVVAATARENMTLSTLTHYFSGGLLHYRREETEARTLMREFDVRPPEPNNEFSTFSGGNQQKMLIAKWFATQPTTLLLHEPTIGVDVGAKRQIFRLIRDAAQQGTAVVIASIEYEDLAHLCDRVIVFRHGRAVSELHGSDLTLERILERSFIDAPITSSTPGDQSEP